jgi:hypothetical protein
MAHSMVGLPAQEEMQFVVVCFEVKKKIIKIQHK